MLETLFNSEYCKNFQSTYLQDIREQLRLKIFMKVRKVKNSEAAAQTCSSEMVFWKYAANLPEGTHAEVRFQQNIRNKWECISLRFCLMTVFLWSLYLHKYLFDVVRNKLQNNKYLTRVDKKKIKSSRKENVITMCFTFWPMKNIFQKL